ncbi:MAG TPA: hypothetical protein VH208_12180 [Myxococcaceae bacterium]|nr:hypothetical protein [Myxococcaceae bacterium]
MRSGACLAVLALLGACTKGPSAPQHRAELHKLGGEVIELVPAEGVPAFCVVFTISEKSKIIRQLTMNRRNDSFRCQPGTPIGNVTFRIPADEGPVKVYVFFSDQRLNAGSIAQQLYELSARPTFNVLDLRAPGNVMSERFDFTPEAEAAPSEGEVVGAGGALAEDAGAAAAPAPPAPAPTDAGAAAAPVPRPTPADAGP